MLAGPSGTAAAAAAGAVLAAEGGVFGLFLDGLLRGAVRGEARVDAVAAYGLLRGRLPIVPWRPNLMFKVYAKSRHNLWIGCPAWPDGQAGGPHRAFGAVVGNCPFAHTAARSWRAPRPRATSRPLPRVQGFRG